MTIILVTFYNTLFANNKAQFLCISDIVEIIKFHLYRNGWREGCNSAEQAEKVIEKFYPPLNYEIRNGSKVLAVNKEAKQEPGWQWRGLAKRPPGLHRIEPSDKYK